VGATPERIGESSGQGGLQFAELLTYCHLWGGPQRQSQSGLGTTASISRDEEEQEMHEEREMLAQSERTWAVHRTKVPVAPMVLPAPKPMSTLAAPTAQGAWLQPQHLHTSTTFTTDTRAKPVPNVAA
jgi:hypothetical protein